MELVFEVSSNAQFVPTGLSRKGFTKAGGVIGRGEDCDWIIQDRKRHLSNHHALISYHEGAFFLTDTSSNGIQNGVNGALLIKGKAMRIEPGSVYVLGDFEICAELNEGSTSLAADTGPLRQAGNLIPENVFLDFDPLERRDQQERVYCGVDDLTALDRPYQEPGQRADFARIDTENLRVPELVADFTAPASAPVPEVIEHQSEEFWERFGAALGVDLEGLDRTTREAMALSAARLLKQSIGGLQQSLRTRSELKNELRLAQTTVQGLHPSPLKFAFDAGDALSMMLAGKPGQLPAEQVISHAFRDLQAHQVALLAASRAAVRGALDHFSPQQLNLRFERDNRSLLSTSGSRWRAYGRYHQALTQDDEWSERLLARDFHQSYEEQVRLISTLHSDHQG
ncbi:type VI secretion system-associated FHA domain protein TagH [Pseudomonas sp. PD9R]|uniref:type VI secretion system-associated FHA domain protein TagH n=1 Tax=Pseudomonas sp. PD9R TaxID=2853534 RepID=UPI001C45E28A|nr:type VI secretion system-associated FHA domain protein TagH [Pseudomonas sp. PD9R]MBV6825305.1 type VI secretion system-associated FHA domain protein TagH [Pseudomonas sp. PD9R]